MIYFDNAATGGFKPRATTDTATSVLRFLSANPGRSGHRLSLTGAEMVFNTRSILSEYFSATPERVIFTKNCTEALNVAIFGSLKEGGHVITTTFEHNSVLRPLFALKNAGLIELDIVEPCQNDDITAKIEEKIKDNTYLIVATALSNVTGQSLPIAEIGALAKKHGALFIVDGAQGGGHIFLSIKDQSISALALAGHKGLYGIMGSGVLILNDEVDLTPLIYGGTGNESFNLNQPSCYPERLESGTLNLPAIASLYEGVKYIKNNHENFSEHLKNTTKFLIEGLKNVSGIKIYSPINSAGIVSFSLSNLPSAEVADILSSEYDIAVRAGLHCAPLAHKHLNTEQSGLVRASLAVQNSSREIEFFLQAINEISRR